MLRPAPPRGRVDMLGPEVSQMNLLGPILVLSALLPTPSRPGPAQVVTHVATRRPVIAITINDGPDGRITPAMLRLLREQGAQATFFVSGRAIADDPQMLLEIQAARCEVENHGYHHQAMRGWPQARIAEEVRRTDHLVADALGGSTHYVRPPYGDVDATLQRVARRQGEQIVLWNVGGSDETVHVWPKDLHRGDIVSLRDDAEGLRRLRQALGMAAREHLRPVTLSVLLAG